MDGHRKGSCLFAEVPAHCLGRGGPGLGRPNEATAQKYSTQGVKIPGRGKQFSQAPFPPTGKDCRSSHLFPSTVSTSILVYHLCTRAHLKIHWQGARALKEPLLAPCSHLHIFLCSMFCSNSRIFECTLVTAIVLQQLRDLPCLQIHLLAQEEVRLGFYIKWGVTFYWSPKQC